MSDQTLDRLTARVETLERQNRRLKRGAVAIVALGLCGGAAAQTLKPAPIAGARFSLVDAMDRTRATLENFPGNVSGQPVITFLDEKGQPRVRLGLGPRGALLEVIDENGKTRDYFGPPGVRPATQ